MSRLPIVVQSHYENPARTTHNIARWGFTKTATALEKTFPTTAKARSGDLGEILATEYGAVRFPAPKDPTPSQDESNKISVSAYF